MTGHAALIRSQSQKPPAVQARTIPGPADKKLTQLAADLNARTNRTGLPDRLKTGIESLSGTSLDGVKVHYNSSRPAQLNTHAFAQRTDIHLAPGQERHLPHEAWHVVQQAQGRVRPTTQFQATTPINDEKHLEHEADVMGAQAAQLALQRQGVSTAGAVALPPVVQRALVTDPEIIGAKNGTYNWTGFRGTRAYPVDGTAKEQGRGAALTTGEEWQSVIHWQAIDPGSGEGTGVNAVIGPDHHLGSNPSAPTALARVKAFKALSGKTYISGHLLNEKLGGPGDDPHNLTAIPGTANTLQSSNIESEVREPVNEEGRWMHYAVDIGYADDTKLFKTDDARKRAGQAATENAGGVLVQPQINGDLLVTVRYAHTLSANWYLYDVDGNMARQQEAAFLTMASPLQGAGSVISPTTYSGIGTGKSRAKTKVDAEELVLTTSNLLKHVVDNRAPLVERINELRANIDLLKDNEQEASEAYQSLIEEAEALGWRAGHDFAYYHYLAEQRLAPPPDMPELINEEAFRNAFAAGQTEGKEEAAQYIRGYNAGHDQGWSDLAHHYGELSPRYVEGYDRGHDDGVAQGDYHSGKKYVFHNISLLSNIHEWAQNVFWHPGKPATVALTGHWFTQPNGPKWYEVQLLAIEGENPKEELGKNFWMKRAWLNKGW
jgi:hypothetical protein